MDEKPRLPWNQATRSQYAWGLLARNEDPRRASTKLTQGEIARRAGVSVRTVSTMAGTLRDLLGRDEDALRMTWAEARDEARDEARSGPLKALQGLRRALDRLEREMTAAQGV
jgi:hypothetical protein